MLYEQPDKIVRIELLVEFGYYVFSLFNIHRYENDAAVILSLAFVIKRKKA